MHIEPKQVTEFHIKLDSLPGKVFTVRAETPEKAAKKLAAEFRAAIVELTPVKQKEKSQPQA